MISHTLPLDGLLPQQGARKKPAGGLACQELQDLGQYQIRARRGQCVQLAKAIARKLNRKTSLARLEGAVVGSLFIAATGPDEFWVMTTKPATRTTYGSIEKLAAGQGSVFDQSHGRAVVRISGVHAEGVLAKGMPLDLSDPNLPRLWAAHTTLEHIPALIVKRATDRFDVSFARSYAGSFAHWLEEAAREFG